MIKIFIEIEHGAPNGCKTISHDSVDIECKKLEEILDFEYSTEIQYRKVTIISSRVNKES